MSESIHDFCRFWRAGIACAALASLLPRAAPAQADGIRPSLHVSVGVTAGGGATDQWLAMLRKRLSTARYDSVAPLRRQLTEDEKRWVALIRSRLARWEGEIASLAQTFRPISPPASTVIILGNRGAEDAFVHEGTTIGFDLAALGSVYGSASQPENLARVDRLFRHEYVHLLQKAWLREHPYPMLSPLDSALMDIWAEGIGNYHSLSERWRAKDGLESERARKVLAALEPRFVARLAALACAAPGSAGALLQDLSSGPFEQKWGALPAALWLEAERSQSEDALRRFLVAGPDGVWELAQRRLAPPLKGALAEARRAASLCSRA